MEGQNFSDNQKKRYYQNRVNDASLSQGQRDFAARRLAALTNSPAPAKKAQTNPRYSAPHSSGEYIVTVRRK